MTVDTVVTQLIHGDMEACFKAASGTFGLPVIFPGKGIIPGVEVAWIDGGGPQTVGATRLVKTLDGNTVAETYIEWNPPSKYAYEMTELKAPLSLMLRKATGIWEFSEEQSGTRVNWTYKGELTNFLASPATNLLVKVFLKGAMQDCIDRVKRVVESPKVSQGWLEREADDPKSWERQWFVLVDNNLSVSASESSPATAFDLSKCVVGDPKHPREGHPNSLRIDLKPTGKFILDCGTHENLEGWKTAVAMAGIFLDNQAASAAAAGSE